MALDGTITTFPTARLATPRLRLRYGKLIRTAGLMTFLVFELTLWAHIRAVVPQPGQRFVVLLYLTYKLFFIELIAWALTTLVIVVVYHLLARPLIMRWYNPRPRDSSERHPLPFIPKSNEHVLAEISARRVRGRLREPGLLVHTNHALYFSPFAWDSDAWMLPLEHIAELTTHDPPRRVLHLIAGYPYNLVVRDDSAEETVFVVADPGVVLSWFDEEGPVMETSTLLAQRE